MHAALIGNRFGCRKVPSVSVGGALAKPTAFREWLGETLQTMVWIVLWRI
jgi:hypothetical protein